MAQITISCDTCIMDGTAACADCVVTHLLAPAPYEHRLTLRSTDSGRARWAHDGEPDLGWREADGLLAEDEWPHSAGSALDDADARGDDTPEADGHVVRPSREALVFDLDELRAMRLLAEAGLVPTLRHREAP